MFVDSNCHKHLTNDNNKTAFAYPFYFVGQFL